MARRLRATATTISTSWTVTSGPTPRRGGSRPASAALRASLTPRSSTSNRSASTLDELVLYELHVGTFTEEGTFDGAIRHLGALAELGVTAVEVMPIATFPGHARLGL